MVIRAQSSHILTRIDFPNSCGFGKRGNILDVSYLNVLVIPAYVTFRKGMHLSRKVSNMIGPPSAPILGSYLSDCAI